LKRNTEKYDIEIYSYFDKNASWVKYKTTGLSHEQGHFDIEEIYARRLKKIINSKKFFRHRLSLKIDKIVEVINQQCITYQELYDSETDFHNNFNKQIEWEIKIQKELNALDDYVKNNTFRVKTFGKGT